MMLTRASFDLLAVQRCSFSETTLPHLIQIAVHYVLRSTPITRATASFFCRYAAAESIGNFDDIVVADHVFPSHSELSHLLDAQSISRFALLRKAASVPFLECAGLLDPSYWRSLLQAGNSCDTCIAIAELFTT
jgi:hypothetical protein